MWLINADTLQLHNVIDADNAPPYAILSHTWGEEEITFKHMQTPTDPAIQAMLGFRKIQFTCDQAKKDGIAWAWVDTCCIDKSSSSELSEAINSMFRWYQVSAVCYAYLQDIDHRSGEFEDLSDVTFGTDHIPLTLAALRALARQSWASFAASRWFTRGWTLQELLAPSKLVFYDLAWQLVGSKHQLLLPLSYATRIPVLALRRPNLIHSFSIAARMSWASRRQTSRVEDTAYCLLGIFDVNMPMLYGEGAKAFQRLQTHLLETSADESLFMWDSSVSGSRVSDLFATSPQWFDTFDDCIPIQTVIRSSTPTLTKHGLMLTGNLYGTDLLERDELLLELNCRPSSGGDLRGFLGLERALTEFASASDPIPCHRKGAGFRLLSEAGLYSLYKGRPQTVVIRQRKADRKTLSISLTAPVPIVGLEIGVHAFASLDDINVTPIDVIGGGTNVASCVVSIHTLSSTLNYTLIALDVSLSLDREGSDSGSDSTSETNNSWAPLWLWCFCNHVTHHMDSYLSDPPVTADFPRIVTAESESCTELINKHLPSSLRASSRPEHCSSSLRVRDSLNQCWEIGTESTWGDDEVPTVAFSATSLEVGTWRRY